MTHKAVMTACRPQPGLCVKEIYAFEVLSSTEWQTPGLMPFILNVYVDIVDYIDIKRQVLEAYTQEMRQPLHTRSIENVMRLSALRGCAVGLSYVEVFYVLRLIRNN